MSRTTSAVLLALGFAFVAGCGKDSESPLPAVKVEEPPVPPPALPTPLTPDIPVPKVEPAKVELPKGAGWELDQTKHAIPAAPIKGIIGGVEVAPVVLLEGTELTFRVYKPGAQLVDRSVRLELAPMLVAGQQPPNVLGRGWAVKLDADAGPGVPVIWREITGKDPHLYPSGYALSLELGVRKDGKISGKIYLSLADEEKTFLAGTFEAQHVRPHTERPGPDDGPYIAGEVTVTGAKPTDEVRVSYVAFTGAGVFFKELQLPFDSVPEQQARWTRDESDKPRTSTFVAGDGRTRGFRYEHVKLAPGRYLIAAGVVGGPAVCKWIDLPPGGTLTENIAIDVTKTGSVEVSVPLDVKGQVYVAPADAPDKAPIEMELFVPLCVQSVRQNTDIVAGKAVVKNLAPGRYEIRAGIDLRGFIDVTAGKTAELALMPPKK